MSNMPILDPTTFTAIQKKAMGMWPPNLNIGAAIAPELRRMGREIDILDLGVGKGESIVFLLDNVSNIRTIFGLVHTNEHDVLLGQNLDGLSKINPKYSGEEVDVLLITMLDDTTGQTLADYYSKLKVGGIIIGDRWNDHNPRHAVSDFRKTNKITVNINIIQKEFWFWKKR